MDPKIEKFFQQIGGQKGHIEVIGPSFLSAFTINLHACQLLSPGIPPLKLGRSTSTLRQDLLRVCLPA